MIFETKKEVLDWYEKQPRTLTDKFISELPWDEVSKHPIDPRFFPVIRYMRDVETLTDMYHQEMMRTPTGKDPVIGKFMERWGVEEVTHGEVLNRFLNEAGIETEPTWQHDLHTNVSKIYRFNTYLVTTLTKLVGREFTGTHMTFGAIHEMTTAQAYRRLIEIADHPVLTQILTGIIREESAHTQFYWSVARLELERSEFSRKMARFVVNNFYYPVGQGSRPKKETGYAISTLFGEGDSINVIDKTVTQRARQLPGFEKMTKVTETISDMANKEWAQPLPS